MKSSFKHLSIGLIGILLFGEVAVRADDIQVTITSPVSGSTFELCSDVDILLDITVNSGSIKEVNFYRNGTPAAYKKREPYVGSLKKLGIGYYEITAGVVDSKGHETISEPIYFIVGDWIQGNLIINGQFDCVLSPWRIGNYEGGVGTATLEPEADIATGGAVLVEINNPGDLYWYIQLIQDFPITAGHTYEITFIAEVPEEKTIYISLQQNHSPYYVYLELPVELDGNNAYGPFVYECTQNDSTVDFKFHVGGNDVPVYFDEVMIVDLNMEPVTHIEQKIELQPVDHLYSNNYPNPFNGQTRIFYYLPEPAHVDIRLFNVQGEQILDLLTAWQSEGYHSLQWDGLDHEQKILSTGIYIYTIEAISGYNTFRNAKRVHLLR